MKNQSICYKIFVVATCFLVFHTTLLAQIFSNTSTQACGHALFTNNFATTFSRTIAVSGLGNNLGTNAFLHQINVEIGSPACTRNLTTYSLQIVSPSGTTYVFQSGITSTATAQWLNIKFRDNPSLERIDEYSLSMQQNYWPYCIGYYQTETENGFTTFDGEDPNGNWTFKIADNTATSGLSFSRVDLVFGSTALNVNSAELSSGNNACSGSSCLSSGVTTGNNNGYANNDPLFAGTAVDGCSWNGANNNSAWFHFFPSGTTATITLSGIVNTVSPGISDTQPIVLEAPTPDNCTVIPTQVATGGCPEIASPITNCYVNSSDPYTNGISANAEFNLTGLTPGNKYYVYVDGNGGISSSFYIELQGASNVCSVFPIILTSFEVYSNEDHNFLTWKTLQESNNHYFDIERSNDGYYFSKIGSIKGAGTTNKTQVYTFKDFTRYQPTHYYRLKQVNYDGTSTYSNIEKAHNEFIDMIDIQPNPCTDRLEILHFPTQEKVHISIINTAGVLIVSENIQHNMIDLKDLTAGIYYIKIQVKNQLAVRKLVKI